MNVQHHQPNDKILQKHIEFYYFLKTDDSNFATKYYAFPHILTPLSIHRNVEPDIQNHSISVMQSSQKNHLAIVQGMRKQPLFVKLKGRLDKITIVFKPLGLNHFVKRSFARICPGDSQVFTEWNDQADYQEFLRNFYQTGDQVKRIEFLEHFLLKIYQPIESRARLEKSIALLTDFEEEKTIEKIADEIGLNIRTFNRIFKENIGISPIGFKKIARFRHSLNDKFCNEQFKRLTDIAYHSNFYDQSYFINIYKQMTGSNPKLFFEKLEKVGADKLLFQFLKP
jgi:AraC-like DNA-binding protein